jgi:hypothetical protein
MTTSYDDDNMNYDDGTPPEESNNRTFLLIAGGLGLLVLIALCALVGFLFLRNNTQAQATETAIVLATQQQATIEVGLTMNALSLGETQTAAVTNTVPPTNTPVIAQATATLSPTSDPATMTVAAAFTQIAASTQTVIATSTALPNTGFADDVGAPGLIIAALALVIVIFLVRRLRATPVR